MTAGARWAAWEQGVFSRFKSAVELQRLILDRQVSAAAEEADRGDVPSFSQSKIRSIPATRPRRRVLIP